MRYTIFFLTVLVAAFFWRYYPSPRTYTVVVSDDSSIDARICKQVVDFVNQKMCQHQHNSSLIMHELHRKYSWINRSECLTGPDGIVRICLSDYKPLCILNGTHLLLENGSCVPCAWYSASLYSGKPCLRVPEFYCAVNSMQMRNRYQSCIDDVYRFYCYSDAALFRDYFCEWLSADTIILHKKDTGDCIRISCDAYCTYGMSRVQDAQKLVDVKRSCEAYKKTTVCADIRFKNHIVMSYAKKGEGV